VSSFGIDFGTTNSCAVEIQGPTTLPYGDETGRPLPSLLVIDRATGNALCGREVWNKRLSYREKGGFRVVPSLKKLLENGDWREGQWTVPLLIAEVLKHLSKRAAIGGRPGIANATFSVPAGLAPQSRRTLRKAAHFAGIQVNGFISESTAALMRYWPRMRDHRYVAVFDWGGGTLDVSVLEVRGQKVFERYTRSLAQAGTHIDEELAQHIAHPHIMRQRGLAKAFEEMAPDDRNELVFRCEAAKIALSRRTEVDLVLESYDDKPASLLLSRRDCGAIVGRYVRQAVELLAHAIREARLSRDELQDVIVIGGSSQLWLLAEMLGREFPGRYKLAENPEWDVAHGAAIVEQNPGKFTLAETLGLRLSDDSYFELVRPGDRPSDGASSLSLALVEDSSAANIIIDRWTNDYDHPRSALQFAISSLGFDQEEVSLSYRLTEDLTFHIAGQSRSRGPSSLVERETGELRFGYEMQD
jgi:molecular chaperone DnaK